MQLKHHIIGVDIGSHSIKIVNLKRIKDETVAAIAVEEVYPNDFELAGSDSKLLSNFIKSIFKKNKIKTKNICTSLHGNDVIVKHITMPSVDRSELQQAVTWEAEQYIPYDIKEVNIGFQLLPSDDGSKTELLIAASKKEIIEKQRNIIKGAGLKSEIIDVDSLAIANCFEQNYETSGMKYLLDIGYSYSKFNIINNGMTLFTRDAPIGVSEFITGLSDSLSIDAAASEKMLRDFNVDNKDQEDYEKIRGLIEEGFEKILASVISSSIEFFSKDKGSSSRHKLPLYVSGGGALISGILQYFEEKLDSEVELLNPFSRISIDLSKINLSIIKDREAIFATAVGLGLRGIL